MRHKKASEFGLDIQADSRQRLIDFGAEALADALLKLATGNKDVVDVIERMLATPDDNIKRFKAKLSELKQMKYFIDWKESGAFVNEMENMLEDLKTGVDNPRTGIELLVAFYETDDAVLNNCDDSDGDIGNVYMYDACDLFVHFAAQCEDKDWICDVLVELNREDEFGTRDSLVDRAADYLPEESLRNLAGRFWKMAETGKEPGTYLNRHYIRLVQSIARQLKDATLFEKATLAIWPKLSMAACMQIAKIYLVSGNAETALSWMQRIPKEETLNLFEQDELLLAIYEKLDNKEKQTEVAWHMFHSHRSEKSLSTLIAIIGEENREQVLTDEVSAILKSEWLSYSDATFLIQTGRIDDAETYLLDRANQLNGDLYYTVLPLAETMEKENRFFAASIIYRSLLDSILRRGRSTTYHHGVDYLKQLDNMAGKIGDWRGALSHAGYMDKLRGLHGRKYSFWSQYRQ